jgi:hypothetical protein
MMMLTTESAKQTENEQVMFRGNMEIIPPKMKEYYLYEDGI